MGSRKKEPSGTKTAIGIDFGSSKCCVGLVRNGKVEILENEHGNKTTPSFVAFTETERLIGESARDQVALNPTNTVFGSKQLLGRKGENPGLIKRLAKHLPYDVTQENSRVRIKITYKGKEKKLSPEQIAAMLLSQMKKLAEKHLDFPVREAVIAVPAHFTNAQRRALKDAGTIAGLTVLGLISETTAAAVAYQDGKTFAKKQNVLVVDIGGGAFNAAVVKVQDASVEVKAICGTPELSGGELDRVIVEHLSNKFTNLNKVDLKSNKKAIERLKIACQKAKHTLTLLPESVVQVDCLAGKKDFCDTIKRAEVNDKYLPAAQKTIEKVLNNVLSDATLTAPEIDEVLLIGGTTRVPAIQEALVEFFAGKLLNKTVNPDEAVAHGAALHAAILAGDNTVAEVRVTDIVKNPVDYADRIRKRKSFVPITTIEVPRAGSNSVIYCEHIGRKHKSTLEHVVDSFGVYSPRGNPDAIKNQPKTHVDLMKVNCYLNDVEIRDMKSAVKFFDDEDLNYNLLLSAVSVLEALCFKVKGKLLPLKNSERQVSGGHVSKRTEALTNCEECLEWLGRNEVALVKSYQEKTNKLHKLFAAAETEMMSKSVDVPGHMKEAIESYDVGKAETTSESGPSIVQMSDLLGVPAGHNMALRKEIVVIKAENSGTGTNGEREQPVNESKTRNEIDEQDSNATLHANAQSVSANDGSAPHECKLREKNNATMMESAPTDDGNAPQDDRLEEKDNATMIEGATTAESFDSQCVNVGHTDNNEIETLLKSVPDASACLDLNSGAVAAKGNALQPQNTQTDDDEASKPQDVTASDEASEPQDVTASDEASKLHEVTAADDEASKLQVVTATDDDASKPHEVTAADGDASKPQKVTAADDEASEPQDVTASDGDASKPQEVTAADDEALKPQEATTADDEALKPQEATTADNETSKPQEVTAADNEASKPHETLAAETGAANKQETIAAAIRAAKKQMTRAAANRAAEQQETHAAACGEMKNQETIAAGNKAAKRQKTAKAANGTAKQQKTSPAANGATKQQEPPPTANEAAKLQEPRKAANGPTKQQEPPPTAIGAAKQKESLVAAERTTSEEIHSNSDDNRLVEGNHRTKSSPLEPCPSSGNWEGKYFSEAGDLLSLLTNGITEVTNIQGLAATVTPGVSIDGAGHQGEQQRDELSHETCKQADPMTNYGVANEEQSRQAHYEKTSSIQPSHNPTTFDVQSQNEFQEITGNGELGIFSGAIPQHHASPVANADSAQISIINGEFKEETQNYNNPHEENGSIASGQHQHSRDHNTSNRDRRGTNARAGLSFHSTRGHSNGRHPPPPPVTPRQGASAGPQRFNDRMHSCGEEQNYYQQRFFSNSLGRGRGMGRGSRNGWPPHPDYGHCGNVLSGYGWPAVAQPSYFNEDLFQFWQQVSYEYHTRTLHNGCFYCKLNSLRIDDHLYMRKQFLEVLERHPPWCSDHEYEVKRLLRVRRN